LQPKALLGVFGLLATLNISCLTFSITDFDDADFISVGGLINF